MTRRPTQRLCKDLPYPVKIDVPTSFGDRPSSGSTRTFGRSPPESLSGHCTLT
ncbi:hypothetical protein HNI00_00345 [Thermoleptolyngbya oregonensis NK1-22]|uniref:Uncharacterized protein n=1 Tax=Thermoleptolyngbya oregonensis NK1-22 TaxID=2547457 RepID=A0AA97B957_9CYAN|nr:hypothetical protein [Thermoleptolyngbya oregonensis]WOB41800.1 hypothetical protein HNI00_00345 [Thermoleptolyngbya oregonensis NK1-22]